MANFTSAKDEIKKALYRGTQAIVQHEEAIRREEDRLAYYEKLLKYAECPKCEGELVGGVQDAVDEMEAAESIGRKDVPCAFCDTQEQQEAMAKALDLVVR